SNHLAGTTNAALAGGGVPGTFRRFATEPGLIGLDRSRFRDKRLGDGCDRARSGRPRGVLASTGDGVAVTAGLQGVGP
ncbi:MAG TPA: hypothetical protein VGD71_15975, partial [Kribbella sp.]